MSEPFELLLDGVDAPLLVLGFRGREAVSACYRFDVDVALTHPVEHELLGLRSSLRVLTSREPRTVHGIVSAIQRRSRRADGRSVLRVRLEPQLARLKHASHWQIFHDASVVQVADAVLAAHQVAREWRLLRQPHARPHRVQRGERDLAFVERILADEGIFFWFEQGSQGEVVVLADEPASYPALPLAGVLPHKGSDALHAGSDDVLFDLVATERLRAQGSRVQLFDWSRPHHDASDRHRRAQPHAALELDEHEHACEGLARTPALAIRRLDEARRGASRASATTLFPHVAPGHWFGVDEHSEAALNRDYVVIAVQHTGRSPREGGGERAYEALLTLAPRDVPLRPRRRTQPLAKGLETATVMGPVRSTTFTSLRP